MGALRTAIAPATTAWMDPTKRHLTPATMSQHQHHPLHHLQHQLTLLSALKPDKMIYARLLANQHVVASSLVSRQLAVLTRSTAPTHLHGLRAVSASAHLHHQHRPLRHQHRPLRHLQHHRRAFLHALKLERRCCARSHANQHVVASNLVSRQLAVLTRSTAPTHLHGLKAVSATALLPYLLHSTSVTLLASSTLWELMATTRASASRSPSVAVKVSLTSGRRMAGSTRATRCGLMASAILLHSLLCPALPRISEDGLQPRTPTKCPAAETSTLPNLTQQLSQWSSRRQQ